MSINALNHPKHDEASDQERPAVTEKRQGQPRDRGDSNSHTYVDEDMSHQQNGNAYGKHAPEAIGCLGCNLQTSEDDDYEGAKSKQATDQAGFLRHLAKGE